MFNSGQTEQLGIDKTKYISKTSRKTFVLSNKGLFHWRKLRVQN
jgi:hypothetical protein